MVNGLRSLASARLDTPGSSPRQELAYGSNWEHLQDEFSLLDLRIQLCALRQQSELESTARTGPRIVGDEAGPTSAHALRARILARQEEIGLRREAGLQAAVPLALPRLASLFRLGAFEQQCLLACLAAEVDAKVERQYGALQQTSQPRAPSATLLLELLCTTQQERLAGRLALSAASPLWVYRLLQPADAGAEPADPGGARALRIDARIADCLLGAQTLDARILPAARLVQPGPSSAPPASALAEVSRMLAFIRHHLAADAQPRALVFQLHGPDAGAQRAAVEVICRELALPLVSVDTAKLATGPLAGEGPWIAGREAVLLPAALCLEATDCWLAADAQAPTRDAWLSAIRHFSQLSFLLGRSPALQGRSREGLICIDVEFAAPGVQARRALWEESLRSHGLTSAADAGELASRFRFDAQQIRDAIEAAWTHAYWRDPAQPLITADDVRQACRQLVSARPAGLAQRVVPVNRWTQLVLPADQLRQLRELCDQARNRHIVYGEWGFERRLSMGNGLNALFTGPPGTGKTMAAEVVAAELQAELLKIDLSQTVSKYIGETEKNLDQLFSQAEAGHAILFFDEADALFGKRSEVKDAHDRYANIETGYLLQRMEQHQGIVILATNLRNNLDDAFCRRMHFVVEFPFPDEAHRRRLWEGLFPCEVPRDATVDLDFMARRFKVPGGNIRNIGVCAAFLAAAEGGGVEMRHLIHATRREYRKLGWPCNANDFGPYHEMLKALDG